MAGKVEEPSIIHSEEFKSDNFVNSFKYRQDSSQRGKCIISCLFPLSIEL